MKPPIKMFSLVIALLLVLSGLSACQREAYQPTVTPGATEAAVSTPLSTSTVTPGPTEDDPAAATSRPDWEMLYTEANPVSDPEELIAILQDLYNRFMAQFDRPGWYRFYGMGDLGERVTWVQINEPETGQFDGLLELVDNPDLYAPGFIWPITVVGPEGQVGFTHQTEAMDDYYFLERSAPFDVLDELDHRLDNVGYFAGDYLGGGPFGHLMLLRVIQAIQDPVDIYGAARRDFSFEGWVDTYETQAVFMFKTTTLYSGALPFISTSDERLVREESYTCFDLQNGGAIATKTDYWYQSGNSDVGDWWMDNFHLVERFDVLPEREQQIYDEALRRLDAFNQGNSP